MIRRTKPVETPIRPPVLLTAISTRLPKQFDCMTVHLDFSLMHDILPKVKARLQSRKVYPYPRDPAQLGRCK